MILVGAIFSITLAMLIMMFFAIGLFSAFNPYAIPSTSAIYPGNISIISGGAGLP